MAQRGGRRPGAGRKKGKVSQAKRDLAALARDHAELAMSTLVDVAHNGESEAARVSAATAILDRGFGKPKHSLDLGGEVSVKTLADFYGGGES
jgi:hypothetical protein